MSARRPRTLTASALLAAALAFSLPRQPARAEDSVDYKYENYREEDGRITVVTESGSANEDVGAFGHLSLTGTMDAVAGATPTGRPAPDGSDQVVLTEIHTRRKAWSGDYSEQIQNVNIDAGFAESRESDYVSRGWSLNTLTDFNEKNTTLRAGVAGTDDRVEVFYETAYLPKHTNDAILGVTQVLDPLTFVTLNVSLGRSTGELAEPHKFVEKGIDILPGLVLEESFAENSPNERNRESVYASINRAFPKLKGAIEGSYRFYADSYGIVAHTLQVDWQQHVGPQVILEPMVRLYQQSAARFYYYNLDDTPIVPVRIPNGTGPYYSSDFRLSAEDSTSFGLKATWKASERIHLDASYERYALSGRDGVTPQSAYPTANITTVGIRFIW
jgi:hypothetical protein